MVEDRCVIVFIEECTWLGVEFRVRTKGLGSGLGLLISVRFLG